MEPGHDPSADPSGVDAQSPDPTGRRTARVIVQRSGDGGRILIHPNRSLNRAGLLVATAACLSALMPATLLCLLLGAWPLARPASPGSEYRTLAIMKDPAKALSAGLVIAGKEFCVTCHRGAWSDDLLRKAHAHKPVSP